MFNTFNSFNNFIKPAGDAEIFSIKEAVDNTIAMMHDFITINSVNVERDFKGDPVLEGLSNELEQVLMNIIKNSIDEFNERGIAERMLSIAVSRNNGMNYVRIKDKRRGIKLDNLPVF
jgi:C4-dicarboxylate-specific signal transduction histidine kinase